MFQLIIILFGSERFENAATAQPLPTPTVGLRTTDVAGQPAVIGNSGRIQEVYDDGGSKSLDENDFIITSVFPEIDW